MTVLLRPTSTSGWPGGTLPPIGGAFARMVVELGPDIADIG